MSDPVNHPTHYVSDPSGVECITITRHRNFNVGNAIKYLWRAGLKDESMTIQDLKKAIWYIQDEICRLELFNIDPEPSMDEDLGTLRKRLASTHPLAREKDPG